MDEDDIIVSREFVAMAELVTDEACNALEEVDRLEAENKRLQQALGMGSQQPQPTIGRALALTLYARHHVEPGELGAQTSVAEVEPVSPQALAQWLNGTRFRGDDITRRCDQLNLKATYTPGQGWTVQEMTP